MIGAMSIPNGSKQQDLFQTEPPPWELDDQDDWVAAAVVFSQPPFGPYDYLVPGSLIHHVKPGARVRVPLGRSNRTVAGYCVELIRATDEKARSINRARLKPIAELVDTTPLLNSELLALAQWISEYYLCKLGTTIEAIIPPGVRDQSGTREIIFLSPSREVLDHFDTMKFTKTQRKVLQTLLDAGDPLTIHELAESAGCTQGPIKLLRERQHIVAASRRVWQKDHSIPIEKREQAFQLNRDQQRALEQIGGCVESQQHDTFLIHGITGSGKTEVYIQAIEKVIGFGRQAIVLVPEISLTPQTRQRFRARFERVAVLHSHMTPAERAWHWKQIAAGQIQVIIGARSAIFAPTPQLGMIVIDEEHDNSFKQDSQPRYHARAVAAWRAKHSKVPLLLGSATPALESWQAAKSGRCRLISLPRRVMDRPLPDVATIDLRTEFKSRQSRGAVSRQLHSQIRTSLNEGGQVILLLNRRGYSTSIQCPSCGNVVECPDCSIPLTHHREDEKAICHYCDHAMPTPNRCPDCGTPDILFSGFGTQKLEREIRARFADVTVMRMDTDTMQKPGSHERALDEFRAGKTQILLGTQMIAKGLDFPNVTLVGVINADTALHFPDFRAAERTFQLVTQVAGRSGRGDKGGRVLVQTFSPEHPAISAATNHDFARFANFELKQREPFFYPPYGRMARAVIRGEDLRQVELFAEQMGEQLTGLVEQEQLEVTILGPAPAPVEKLRGKYRYHILLQSRPLATAEPRPQDKRPFQFLFRELEKMLNLPDEVQWIIDIDPQDML